jgi:tight adherence protein B
VSAAAPVLLAAVGGAAIAVALREWLVALPAARRHLEAAARALRLAGSENRSPTEQERRRLGLLTGIALATLAVLVSGSIPLAGIAAAGPAAAGWVVARRRRRYRLAIEADIPVIAAAVADSVAAGGSLRIALPAAATGLVGPSAVEMARVGADLELGIPPHRALAALVRRVPSERLEALIAAVLSQQRAGGDLAGLLRRHGRAAAERSRAEKEARSATAQARMTGGLVVAMPLVMALLVELIAPGFVAGMLAEPVAVVLLAVAGALQVAGFLAIRKLGEVR